MTVDDGIFFITMLAQAFLAFACVTRLHYPLGVRIFCIIQVFQAAETFLFMWPGFDYAPLWFFLDKGNLLLEIASVACIFSFSPAIAWLLMIHAGIKLMTYSALDVDWMFQKNEVYYFRAVLNIVTTAFIAYRMTERINDVREACSEATEADS